MAKKLILFPPHTIDDRTNGEETNTEQLVKYIPQKYKLKARKLLSRLKKLHLTDDNRIIYSDQSIGSNIFDLLTYFVSDVKNKTPRPLDSETFQALLNESENRFQNWVKLR